MPSPISFAAVAAPLVAGAKTVTRRTWKTAYAQRVLTATEAAQPFVAYDRNPRNGGKPIATLTLAAPEPELVPWSDEAARERYEEVADAEGFRWLEERGMLCRGLPPREYWRRMCADARKQGDHWWVVPIVGVAPLVDVQDVMELHWPKIQGDGWEAWAIDFRFDCPECSEPWARVRGRQVDVHYGSQYECQDCGKAVIFAAYSVDQYQKLQGGQP